LDPPVKAYKREGALGKLLSLGAEVGGSLNLAIFAVVICRTGVVPIGK
jgi:hypothetical protein